METLLEVVLIGLLAATLFHAMRLERALGVLKRDRAALERLVADFNASTYQAETSIERLRRMAEGAGQQIARQLDEARALKDDLTFLTERGVRLADRIDGLVRSGRSLATEQSRTSLPTSESGANATLHSRAERELLKALRTSR